jgi:hypothetical protein
MLGPRMTLDHTYLTWSLYSNLSRSHQQRWTEPLLLRKMATDIIYGTPANRSTCPYPVSLPSQPLKQWGVKPPSVDDMLLDLPHPYHQHAIIIFNTCSWGSTHRSLIDTGRGYSLGGVGFPHTTPWPFEPAVSTFYLMAPPGLQFNPILPNILKFKIKGPMTTTWSSDHSAIYCILHLRLAIANNLCLAIGSIMIDRKVILMQLGYRSNSYDLMHNQES